MIFKCLGSLRTPGFREKDYCPLGEDSACPQMLMAFFFLGLLGNDLESKQCHAFCRVLQRKQMLKFSLGWCSFVLHNILAHLSSWGPATQLMWGGDWVPTKPLRTIAFWAGFERRWVLAGSPGSRQRPPGEASLGHSGGGGVSLAASLAGRKPWA